MPKSRSRREQEAAKKPGAFQMQEGGFIRNSTNPVDVGFAEATARAKARGEDAATLRDIDKVGVDLGAVLDRQRGLQKQQGRRRKKKR